MKHHDQYDQFANKWLTEYRATGKTIYCGDGCDGCCHLAVHATYPEAVAVADQLSGQQVEKLNAYVERIKRYLPELPDLKSYLKVHRQRLGPCPLLGKQGSCSIYSQRPLACRALLSTRPAAWCTVDFSTLTSWDMQAYESSLDRQIVAWPTHYVAACKDFGRELENSLLEAMQQKKSWVLSGNFAVMIWLERNYRLSDKNVTTKQQVHNILATNQLHEHPLLELTEY